MTLCLPFNKRSQKGIYALTLFFHKTLTITRAEFMAPLGLTKVQAWPVGSKHVYLPSLPTAWCCSGFCIPLVTSEKYEVCPPSRSAPFLPQSARTGPLLEFGTREKCFLYGAEIVTAAPFSPMVCWLCRQSSKCNNQLWSI